MTVKKQKNGKWLCCIDRKGIPRVRKSFKTEKEADIFERDWLIDHKKKILINTDQRTLEEIIKIWFRYHGYTLSDGDRRRRKLLRLSKDLNNPVASQLTPGEFLDYRYQRTNSSSPLSSKSFNNLHGYLNAVFNKLKKIKEIDYDCPTSDIDFISIQQRQLNYLSMEQINEVLEIAKTSSNDSIWWTAQICLRTGARWGEAESLTKKQLHNESITFEFTKSKKIRTVPLDKQFYHQLLNYCRDKSPTERIFINTLKTFTARLEKSGIVFPKGQKTHILRHTYASYFIMNGGDIVTLQRILGHSDIKMTMRYAHLAPDHLRHAITCGPMANIDNEPTK